MRLRVQGLPAGSLLTGERRNSTVLSADFRSFTTLADIMRPEDVLAMLNGYFEFAVQILHSDGAHVDRFAGDSFLAYWGAPETHPDDPERAIRAAVSIQQALRRHNLSRREQDQPTLEMGMGLSTGMLVAGGLGARSRANYSVLGSIVNLACRLQAMAPAGQILLHESTYLQLRDLVEAVRWRPTVLKGFGEQEGVYQLLGVRKRNPSGGLERRTSLRVETSVRALWHRAESAGMFPEDSVVNLSAGGAAILTTQVIPAGDRIILELCLPGDSGEVISVSAAVLGHQELDPLEESHRYLHRVRFLELSEHDRDRILRFVYTVDEGRARDQGFDKV